MMSLKGLIALSVLVIAMLIALELRDQRSLQGQLEYKNRLLSELSVITGEELADIETTSGNLRQCVEALSLIHI